MLIEVVAQHPLVRFENNIFNVSNTSNMSFDDVYDSAMNGVSGYSFDNFSMFKYFNKIMFSILGSCVFFIKM